MEVTDEMVARYDDGGGADKYDVRAALEAILKDVPEPCDLESAAHWHREYTKLEAKLAQVREWAELHEMANHVDLSDLILDILDGK